jgi:hypothetical protein
MDQRNFSEDILKNQHARRSKVPSGLLSLSGFFIVSRELNPTDIMKLLYLKMTYGQLLRQDEVRRKRGGSSD